MKKLLFFSALFFATAFIVNAQWTEQATGFSEASRGITNISIVDANTVWALAYDGSSAGATIQEFTRTTDGGTTWIPGTIDVGNSTLGISMIHGIDDTTAYIAVYLNSAGTQGIYKTTDGGATWARQTTADFQSATSFTNVVYFWDADNGFCMGDPIGSPAEFELYTTTDGGTTWTVVPGADIPDPLSGEYGYTSEYRVAGDNIWYTTNKGRIYHSTDKGYTWTVSQSPISDFGGTSVNGNVAFVNGTDGLLCDNAANYWKTTDGGATWVSIIPNGPHYSSDLYAIPGSNGTYVSTGNTDGCSFSLYGGSVFQEFEGTTGLQLLQTAWLDESTGWVGSFNVDATTGGIYKFNGTIPTPFNNDLGVLSIMNPVTGAALTNAENVKVEIMNYGINTQSNFDVSYSINGGATVTENITTSIDAGQSYVYTFTATEDFSNISTNNIAVATDLSGDEDSSNDTLSQEYFLMAFTPKKAVVYEEGTGTWCGWCVRGIVGLKDMAHNHTDSSWIGIAVHQDVMTPTSYSDSILPFHPNGFPGGTLDRIVNNVDPGLSTLESEYTKKVNIIPLAKVEIPNQNWNAVTREITFDVTSTFGIDATVDYNIAAIIIENEVTGTSGDYDQSNEYSTSAQGIDLTDWEGTNYKFKPNPIPAADMVYNHVGRDLLGGFHGVSGDIPANAVCNTPYTHSFTYTLPAEYDENHIELIGLILKNGTGEIINAVKVELDANVNIFTIDNMHIKLYPNPTSGQFVVENATDCSIEVFNTLGQRIISLENASSMETINLTGNEAGNYIIRITNENNVITKKINLVK